MSLGWWWKIHCKSEYDDFAFGKSNMGRNNHEPTSSHTNLSNFTASFTEHWVNVSQRSESSITFHGIENVT